MRINYSILAILLGVLGFSLKSIFIKLAYLNGIDSIALMFYRMAFSMPFFIVAYFWFGRKQTKLDLKSTVATFSCAILYYISSFSDITGLQYTSVNIERIILFTIPIFVLIISGLFLKKTYSKKTYCLSFLSWIGVVIAFVGNQSLDTVTTHYKGPLLILLSTLTYATYFIISGEVMKKMSFIMFNTQVMLIACVLSLIPMLFNQLPTITWHVAQLDGLKYPFLLAVFSTVIPSFLIMYGVKQCGAAVTSIINNIGPFMTMTCGYLFLNEEITLFDGIGMVVVMICIFYINKTLSKSKGKQ